MNETLFKLDDLDAPAAPAQAVMPESVQETKSEAPPELPPEEGQAEETPLQEAAPEPTEEQPASDSGKAEEEDDDEEEDEDEDEAKSPKGKEKKPRAPYAWGQCPVTITVHVLPVKDGEQVVRIGVYSHVNPPEPPKIGSFKTAPIAQDLPEAFWTEVRKLAGRLTSELIRDFPNREATWNANKKHKSNPKPIVKNKPQPKAQKAAEQKKAKTKPPSIPDGPSLLD